MRTHTIFGAVLTAVLAFGLAGRPEASSIEDSLTSDGKTIFLSLEEAIRLALEHNTDVRLESTRPDSSKAAVMSEKGIFDPYLELTASKEHEKRVSAFLFQPPGEGETNQYTLTLSQLFTPGTRFDLSVDHNRRADSSTSFILNPYYSSTLSATLTQPVLKGFGAKATKRGLAAARARAEMSMLDFEIFFTRTIRDVAAAYWDVVNAFENLRVAQQALERAKDLREEIEARVQVGLLPPVERAQADAGVASREEAIVVAENTLASAKDRLRLLLGLPVDSKFWDAELSLSNPEAQERSIPSMDDAVRTALEKRPEMRRVAREERLSEIELAYARNQRRPRLDAFATRGYAGLSGPTDWGESFSQVFDEDFPNWTVGLTFAMPLGNRAARGSFRMAHIAREQTELTRESLEKNIMVEVRNAVRNVDANAKRVEAARANRVLQEKNVAVETERHRNGLSTVYQVLQTQADLTSAQSAELKARLDYQLSLVELDRAVGRLAEEHGFEIVE
jgi:outer membrane protein TolC